MALNEPLKRNALRPATWLAETMDRDMVTGATLATSDGTVHLFAIELSTGQKVSAVNFVIGGTGITTPTHQWGLLADSTGLVILGISADATSTAQAAGSTATYTLATPYMVPSGGLFYVGIVTKSSGAPTLAGAVALPASVAGIVPMGAATSTTGISATAPTSPLSALVAQVGRAFAYVT